MTDTTTLNYDGKPCKRYVRTSFGNQSSTLQPNDTLEAQLAKYQAQLEELREATNRLRNKNEEIVCTLIGSIGPTRPNKNI